MEEIYKLTQNKRIFVRKRISSFLEKMLRFCGYDFSHDVYKKIIYSEAETSTPVEEKIKNYYDAYLYLLSNDKALITNSLWKRFYYLFCEKELDPIVAGILSSKYFHMKHLSPIEQAIEYHLFVYRELNDLKEEERLILSLIIFNFILVKNQIPCIQFYMEDLHLYNEAKESFFKGIKTPMMELILGVFQKNPYMDKSYYKNLKSFSVKDIIQFVESNKEEFKTKYHIKGLWVYGSFAKGIERMDSDVDFLLKLSLDLLYEERQAILNELRTIFFDKFKRMIDILEIVEYLEEEILKETTKTIKLI